jgi:hypothetical protein
MTVSKASRESNRLKIEFAQMLAAKANDLRCGLKIRRGSKATLNLCNGRELVGKPNVRISTNSATAGMTEKSAAAAGLQS